MLPGEPEQWSKGVVNRMISPVFKGQNVTMVRTYCDTADCNINRADFITSKEQSHRLSFLTTILILFLFFDITNH